MERFLLSERYRLEVHWKKTVYEQPGICVLKSAYFSGPVLQEALRINDNDYIMLDFFRQYAIIAKNVYVAKLSWGEVEYNSDKTITLKDAKITHNTELNRVPRLKDTDYLVIDTSDHEISKHRFNLVYKTYVINEQNEMYDFRSKK
jgi:hypothetical protein